MEERAQTATETMLILAAAVLIALVVGLFLKGLVNNQIAPAITNKGENVFNTGF